MTRSSSTVGSQALAPALRLLAGELHDSTGKVLTPAASPVVAVRSRDEARSALASGSRAAIAIPLGSSGLVTRINNLGLARFRVHSARRRLLTAGASSVRTFAIVVSGDRLAVAYDLATSSQPYVEDYILLEPPVFGAARAVKRMLRTLIGVSTSVDFVVVIATP